MKRYRVTINSMRATYTERWSAESKEDAEEQARRRWQREFGDARAYRFTAVEDRDIRSDEDDE